MKGSGDFFVDLVAFSIIGLIMYGIAFIYKLIVYFVIKYFNKSSEK
jgi:hypothetical protein